MNVNFGLGGLNRPLILLCSFLTLFFFLATHTAGRSRWGHYIPGSYHQLFFSIAIIMILLYLSVLRTIQAGVDMKVK